ncbi:MAG: hypothetical protein WED04_06525 [Promethearchaeati archaeon SRVP18_Atabeyarchaeia-1]
MSVIKSIDLKEDEYAFYGKKHVIELKVSPGGAELFFDGRKVSSGKLSREFRSIFTIEDKGKQESYEVIVKEEPHVQVGLEVVARVATPADIPGGHTRLERHLGPHPGPPVVPDLKVTRILKAAVIRDGKKAAVIRDGKIVYNEGLLITSTDLKEFQQILQLRDKGVKYGYCSKCDLAIPLPDSRYCPNCGAETEPIFPGENPVPSSTTAQELGSQTAGNGREESCAVCKENFERGDYVAWCPYCGKPAHKIELIKWLNEKRRCPSCEQQLDGKKIEDLLQIVPSSPTMLNAPHGSTAEGRATRGVDILDVKRKLLGVCIVCGEKVYEGDQVARCPHCRGIAHRGDLLEWAHVKGQCPSCGKKLD